MNFRIKQDFFAPRTSNTISALSLRSNIIYKMSFKILILKMLIVSVTKVLRK